MPDWQSTIKGKLPIAGKAGLPICSRSVQTPFVGKGEAMLRIVLVATFVGIFGLALTGCRAEVGRTTSDIVSPR
jgi:hypothetical protein